MAKKINPLGDGYSLVELVDYMGSDASVVRAARVSFAGDFTDRPFEEDEKLIRYLAEHNHGTPFEHTSATFHVSLPIFVVRQWHRHRIGVSYNEVSRRYTSEEIAVYKPHEWRMQAEKNRQASEGVLTYAYAEMADRVYVEAVDRALDAYDRLISLGVAREQARMVLPQSLYTRMYFTGNLRSFAHFYALRADLHAQPEIRAYADALGEILSLLFPVSWSALTGKEIE